MQKAGVRIQMRVLGALVIREMITRYGRSSLGFAWAILEPAAFIALLSVLFSQIAHTPPLGQSFVMFYATGYVAFHWFHDISNVSARSVFVNRPLLAFPPVTPLDTVFARFLLQSVTGFAVALLIFGASIAFFVDQFLVNPAPILLSFVLACILGLGAGLANCWAFAHSRSWELIWGIVSRPLFLVSCVFFTFESMPAFVRDVLWFNPLIHLVGLVREGFYPTYDASHVSVVYVLAVGLALITAGLFAIRLTPCRLVSP